jgi:hypothetical protein
MTAIQKEQIYVELRKYHLDELPESLSNSGMNELLSEYRELEDEAIAMLLGLVNGKSEYVDLSGHFAAFLEKAKPEPKASKVEKAELLHFADKLDQLDQIIKMAHQASFTMRPPRKVRESTRTVVTKVNRS